MKNKLFWLISLLFIILLILGACKIDGKDKYMFLVYLLTAYGTCSVTLFNTSPLNILTIYPPKYIGKKIICFQEKKLMCYKLKLKIKKIKMLLY